MRTGCRLASVLFLFTAHSVAGGPLLVGGPDFGAEGVPLVWNSADPVRYRIDAGPMSVDGLGAVVVDNSSGRSRVQSMFQVWQSVPTASISYAYDGAVLGSNGQTIPDVKTIEQLNDVVGTCSQGTQSPIIFDADGSLISELGLDGEVIAFAGPCPLDPDSSGRHIVAAFAVFDGKWLDGSSGNREAETIVFNAAIAHELGHFSGLDHAQVNVRALTGDCSPDVVAGLPLMFPFLMCEPLVDQSGSPILAPDDVAAISQLYPNAQTTAAYGKIRGTIFFSDGRSHAQGVNVVARHVDDPHTPEDESLRFAVSAVSGALFTGNPGQKVSGTNDFGDPMGSRNPQLIGSYEIRVPPGTYTVEIEPISHEFNDLSRLGPLAPIVGATSEFWNEDESAFDFSLKRDTIDVKAGETVDSIDIIQNSTQPRFDQYENSAALLRYRSPETEREG